MDASLHSHTQHRNQTHTHTLSHSLSSLYHSLTHTHSLSITHSLQNTPSLLSLLSLSLSLSPPSPTIPPCLAGKLDDGRGAPRRGGRPPASVPLAAPVAPRARPVHLQRLTGRRRSSAGWMPMCGGRQLAGARGKSGAEGVRVRGSEWGPLIAVVNRESVKG